MPEDGCDLADSGSRAAAPVTAPRIAISNARAQEMAPTKVIVSIQKRAFLVRMGFGGVSSDGTNRGVGATLTALPVFSWANI